MPIKIGEVAALYRYPVKSMRGELLEVAELGWHGLAGDRRLAFRRTDDRGGLLWLTATKLPDLILFAPRRLGSPPKETSPRMFERRTERSSLSSAKNWRQTSIAAIILRSR